MMPLLIAAFIIIAIVAIVYNAIQAQKRREGLFELAQRLNLSFDPDRDSSISDRFNFLKELNQGENRYATNVLSGTYQGNKVLAFDYHYATVTHDDKGSHTEEPLASFLFFSCHDAGGVSPIDHSARGTFHQNCRGLRLSGHQI